MNWGNMSTLSLEHLFRTSRRPAEAEAAAYFQTAVGRRQLIFTRTSSEFELRAEMPHNAGTVGRFLLLQRLVGRRTGGRAGRQQGFFFG